MPAGGQFITPDALNPAALPTASAAATPAAHQGGQDMGTMLFPASVAGGACPGAGGNVSRASGLQPAVLCNINGTAKSAGSSICIPRWRTTLQPAKRVEFYYLDTRTFRIYAFDDVNTVDSTVHLTLTTYRHVEDSSRPLDWRPPAPASAATPAASRPPARS